MQLGNRLLRGIFRSTYSCPGFSLTDCCAILFGVNIHKRLGIEVALQITLQ